MEIVLSSNHTMTDYDSYLTTQIQSPAIRHELRESTFMTGKAIDTVILMSHSNIVSNRLSFCSATLSR